MILIKFKNRWLSLEEATNQFELQFTGKDKFRRPQLDLRDGDWVILNYSVDPVDLSLPGNSNDACIAAGTFGSIIELKNDAAIVSWQIDGHVYDFSVPVWTLGPF